MSDSFEYSKCRRGGKPEKTSLYATLAAIHEVGSITTHLVSSNRRRGSCLNNDGYRLLNYIRNAQITKPNILQRLIYFLRICPDPRFNGNYFNRFRSDEVGQYKFQPDYVRILNIK